MITLTQLRQEVWDMNEFLRKINVLCKLEIEKKDGRYNLAITRGCAGSRDVTHDTLWGGEC